MTVSFLYIVTNDWPCQGLFLVIYRYIRLWRRMKRLSLLCRKIIRRQAVLKLLLGYLAESKVFSFTVGGDRIDTACDCNG